MRSVQISSLAIASAIAVAGISVPANAAITFLDHFNGQTNFSLNPAQGDYSAGSGTASVTTSTGSTLGTDTGYFGAGDLAYHVSMNSGQTSNTEQYVQFAAPDNLQYTSYTSGGFTAGAWVKMAGVGGTGYKAADVLRLGSTHTWYDHMVLSSGWSQENEPRGSIFDYGGPATDVQSTSQLIDASDWVYLAVTVDLTNHAFTIYDFDKNGVAGPNSGTSVFLPFNDIDLTDSDFVVQIGDVQRYSVSDLWIDEVSLDDQVLTAQQIQDRVSLMAAGNPLSVPEPASVALLGLGAATLIRRRRGR